MMRTRNFRVRSEVVERGSVTTSQKGKPSRRGKWEIVFGGRHMDNVQKETHVVSVMTDKHKETCAVSETKRTIFFSRSKFESQDRRRVRKILTHRPRGKLFRQNERNSVPLRKNCKNKKQSSRFGHPPVCQNYKSENGCICGRKCFFRHVEAEETPSKKSKKDSAKGSVALLKDSCPRRSILREEGKLGSKHAVKFSKGTWHQIKIRERKGPSRGIIQKCEPHERSLCAPKFEQRPHEEETLHKERCAPQSSMGFGEKYSQAQECGQSYVLYFQWSEGNAGTHFEKTKTARIRGRFRSISKLRWIGYFAKIQEPHGGVYSQWWSAYKRWGTSTRSRSKSLRDCAITRRNASCSIAWKTLRRPQIFLWVGRRSETTVD